jgi:hypothetical protein
MIRMPVFPGEKGRKRDLKLQFVKKLCLLLIVVSVLPVFQIPTASAADWSKSVSGSPSTVNWSTPLRLNATEIGFVLTVSTLSVPSIFTVNLTSPPSEMRPSPVGHDEYGGHFVVVGNIHEVTTNTSLSLSDAQSCSISVKFSRTKLLNSIPNADEATINAMISSMRIYTWSDLYHTWVSEASYGYGHSIMLDAVTITASYLMKINAYWTVIMRTPPAPVVASLGKTSERSVEVKWTRNDDMDFGKYLVTISLESGGDTRSASIGGRSQTNHTFSMLQAGKTYVIKIVCYSGDDIPSQPSNLLYFSTAPNPFYTEPWFVLPVIGVVVAGTVAAVVKNVRKKKPTSDSVPPATTVTNQSPSES